MIAIESPVLREQMLTVLRDEYNLGGTREGLHVSDLIYCLTKTYWKGVEPEPPTEDEIGLWAIGWALERVMISRLHVEPLEVDGIVGTIDFAFPDGTPADLKTTRMAPGGLKGAGGFVMPEGWLRQFKSYLYMLNRTYDTPAMRGHSFGVVAVHLIQPEIKVWHLQFSDAELEQNWAEMLMRKDALEEIRRTDDPQPYQHRLGEWECKNCAYNLRCGLAASLAKRSK